MCEQCECPFCGAENIGLLINIVCIRCRGSNICSTCILQIKKQYGVKDTTLIYIDVKGVINIPLYTLSCCFKCRGDLDCKYIKDRNKYLDEERIKRHEDQERNDYLNSSEFVTRELYGESD